MLYYRVCEGAKDYGKYYPQNEDIYKKINTKKAYYQSIYLYNEDQVNEALKEVEVTKNNKTYKRPKGISGITDVITPKLVWDFDDKENPDNAKKDSITLVNRLMEKGFSVDNLGIFFSGSKGFHVEIMTDQLFTPSEFKQLTSSLASDLNTYDSVVSNPARVFRIAYTMHDSTGLYKTRLSYDELTEMSLQEVMDLAQEEYEPESLEACSVPPTFLSLKQKVEEAVVVNEDGELYNNFTIDLNSKPAELSNWKYALSQGLYKAGQKHNARIILAATYKGLKKTKQESYYLLKASADMQSQRFGEERTTKDLLWNVIEDVYSPSWLGGTYSEDNFPKGITDYLEELEIPRFNDLEIDEDLIVDVTEGFTNFYDYAVNIDENRLEFGIEELDNALKAQKGHLIGLLAGPGIGKTSMALEMLSNTSKNGHKSFFGSYDMNSSILFQKLLQRETGLTDDEIYDAYRKRDEEQIAKFGKILEKHYSNVTFCFKVGQSIRDLKRSIAQREQVLGEEIGIVIVDYIELILSDKSDSTQASAEAAQGLREIANSGKVVVVLLQPNKMSSKADEAPKSYNSAKGSSAIAQAVTSMMGCFRPGYDPENPEWDKYFGVAILKNRMGPLGTFYFNWDGPTGRITEMEDIQRQELAEFLKMKKEMNDDNGGLL